MIERNVKKDLSTFKTKVIGPFSCRELVCVILGGSIALSVFFLLRPYILTKALIIISGCFAVPFFACGFYMPYGVPLERFVYNQIKNFFKPTVRKYKTPELVNIESSLGQITYSNKKEYKNHIKEKKNEIKELGSDYTPYD